MSLSSLSPSAEILWRYLAGCLSLDGKLPKFSSVVEFFEIFPQFRTEESFVELSEAGYIIGTPAHYEIKAKPSATKIKQSTELKFKLTDALKTELNGPSATMTLLRYYKAGEKRFCARKARPDSKALIQFRTLIRRYGAETVFLLIEPFFTSNLVKNSPAVFSRHFYNWVNLKMRLKK